MIHRFFSALGLALVIASFAFATSHAGEITGSTVPDTYVVAKGNPCNPCGGKANPCNPCGGKEDAPKPIRSQHSANLPKLVAMGKKLWNDDTLGNSGMSCMSCHDDRENLHPEKGTSWPRYVHMTKDIVTLDQMINFCMINPMEGKPLDPNSIKMTSMAAFYTNYMKGAKAANPCNPCGAKRNPCNPCGK